MKETEEKKDVAETPAEEPVEENMMTKVPPLPSLTPSTPAR